MTYRPLADEIRPQDLDEVMGQKHILGKDGLLRRIIDSGSIPNLVFYGPSGTGKTFRRLTSSLRSSSVLAAAATAFRMLLAV